MKILKQKTKEKENLCMGAKDYFGTVVIIPHPYDRTLCPGCAEIYKAQLQEFKEENKNGK